MINNNNPKPNVQKVNKQVRYRDSKRVLTALSGKQKEPNRGQGTERRPASPNSHVTKPTNEDLSGERKIEAKGKADYHIKLARIAMRAHVSTSVHKHLNKARRYAKVASAEDFTGMGEFQRNPVFEELKQMYKKKFAEDVEITKTPKIFFMRHGRTALDNVKRSDGWLDFPLSDEGRVGLLTAQRFLQDAEIDRIYAAPLKRTRETAEIIKSGSIKDPEVELTSSIKTWNMGNLTGAAKRPNKPIVMHFVDHPDERPHGGETMNEFRQRFLSWLEDCKNSVSENNSTILVVLSGSNLRCISEKLYGDMNVLDIDEGGLVVYQPIEGTWHARVVFGHRDGDKDDWYT